MKGTKTFCIGEVNCSSTRNDNVQLRSLVGYIKALCNDTLEEVVAMLHALLACVFIFEAVKAGLYVDLKMYIIKL